jgi:hypothetical protein
MSLAFALMAAINGSTGSSATLSHGLKGTKPRRRQSDDDKILTPHAEAGMPALTCPRPCPELGRYDPTHPDLTSPNPQ